MSTFIKEKVNIFSSDWCDIVFDRQNKEYGAYVLRKSSSKRHFRAIIISLVLFVLAVSLPVIIKSIVPKQKERQLEVTTLADIKMEDQKPNEEKEFVPPPEPTPPISTIKFVPPVIKPDEEVSDQDELKQQEDLNETKTVIASSDVKGVDTANVDLASLNQTTNQEVVDVEEPPLLFVEQMPSYPGGDAECIKFIKANVKYPEIAKENQISGTVYVSFVVNKDGNITDIKIVRSPDESLSREAIRVVKLMPPWKPGRQNNTAVRVQFNLPIKFTLQ
jgi:protein TonB